MKQAPDLAESALPEPRLSIGVTGHRDSNAAFIANRGEIATALGAVFQAVEGAAARLPGRGGRTRLHSLLAPGVDMMAIEQAIARNWEVAAPLPFGRDLNIAVNCGVASAQDAAAIVRGEAPLSREVAVRVEKMRALADRVRLFELAEQDALVTERLLASLAAPDDAEVAAAYAILASERAAVAARVMIEQSDLIVAVWDGASLGSIGGTRHSIESALYHGTPVIWIDATAPATLRILEGPDAIGRNGSKLGFDDIEALVPRIAGPNEADHLEMAARFDVEPWHGRSSRRFHAYRRIEALFGGRLSGRSFRSLVEHYEAPEAIAMGTAAPFLSAATALPGGDLGLIERMRTQILQRFARADGVSTYLSDAYRGGMVINFLLAALAVIAGVAYLPFFGADWKWPFAAIELLLLLTIVVITTVGRKRRWHGRWLETRRLAEYLRHAPILLMLGVARPRARWPQGSGTQWPEYYARQSLRSVGLPNVRVTEGYLRATLATLIAPYAQAQCAYHREKAKRLATVHHRVDRLTEILFVLAILSVSFYLLLIAVGELGLVSPRTGYQLAKPLTFLGIALPALGGAFAGIRYLGDFERFGAISAAAAEKLESLMARMDTLKDSDQELTYAQVSSVAHTLDDIVISEIESWQSVFAVKNMAVPV